jgi:UTP--glucose-1-phosphate uridylyltransferase
MLMTGDSYDCGKKMGYMQAFVNYGLRNLKEGRSSAGLRNCWLTTDIFLHDLYKRQSSFWYVEA